MQLPYAAPGQYPLWIAYCFSHSLWSVPDPPGIPKPGLGQTWGVPGASSPIKVDPASWPAAVRLRYVPQALKAKVEEAIKEHDEQGEWELFSSSELAHPMVTVMKKDGESQSSPQRL